ncbi:MAG: hypothetical protein VKJ06_02965 [Vampirovibrionales bacterium]|nr:hypothetical protein [Vampirovibrionales bacterium]
MMPIKPPFMPKLAQTQPSQHTQGRLNVHINTPPNKPIGASELSAVRFSGQPNRAPFGQGHKLNILG